MTRISQSIDIRSQVEGYPWKPERAPWLKFHTLNFWRKPSVAVLYLSFCDFEWIGSLPELDNHVHISIIGWQTKVLGWNCQHPQSHDQLQGEDRTQRWCTVSQSLESFYPFGWLSQVKSERPLWNCLGARGREWMPLETHSALAIGQWPSSMNGIFILFLTKFQGILHCTSKISCGRDRDRDIPKHSTYDSMGAAFCSGLDITFSAGNPWYVYASMAVPTSTSWFFQIERHDIPNLQSW